MVLRNLVRNPEQNALEGVQGVCRINLGSQLDNLGIDLL